MDGRSHGIWSRGQDGARLHRFATGVLASIPKPCERKQLPFVDFETVRLLLDFLVRMPSRGPTLLLVPPLRTVRESFQLTRLKFPGTLRS